MGASPTPPSAEPAIAVAVSGGRDSTALLHATARAAQALGVAVHALHVHHGLSPLADAWMAQVRAQCRRWGVHFHLTRLTSAPAAAESVEAWARRERYAALAGMARAAGCDAVLLAHHRRDQAETVLLQLLRGAGARGLAAMPASALRSGIAWLRPWRDHPREAVEAYVRRYRLRFVDDGSNADPRFARNRLRLQLWPALHRAFPEAEAALAHAAMRASEEAACLADLAEADAARVVEGGALWRSAWLQLPSHRRALVLRRQVSLWCGRGAPDSLMQRLQKELPLATGGRWPVPGGELRLYRGRLTHAANSASMPARHTSGETPVQPPAVVMDLRTPGRHPMPGADGAWLVEVASEGGIAIERLRAVIAGQRLEGDRFQARPGAPARSLKKQFQSLGVPAWARSGPVLRSSDGQLLYVPGLGMDARAFAEHGALQFTVSWVPAALV
jgi:tRNA(Ile)-lysidine synthase